MRIAPVAIVLVVLAVGAPGSVSAGQQAPPAAPPAGQPAAPPAGQTPAPAAPAAPTAAAQPRTFTAPAGLLFNTVRADRAEDFEKVMGSLQAALAKSPDEKVRAQAKGWRVFKAAEAGPSGTVLYVFVIDPTVPGADYGLGRILGAAYPDQAQLREIWKLYTGALTGSSLLNLTPVEGGSKQ